MKSNLVRHAARLGGAAAILLLGALGAHAKTLNVALGGSSNTSDTLWDCGNGHQMEASAFGYVSRTYNCGVWATTGTTQSNNTCSSSANEWQADVHDVTFGTPTQYCTKTYTSWTTLDGCSTTGNYKITAGGSCSSKTFSVLAQGIN